MEGELPILAVIYIQCLCKVKNLYTLSHWNLLL
jgi:hypothetical protein